MESNEELKFAEKIDALMPILQDISVILSNERMTLKRLKFQMENNSLTITSQQKEIAQNAVIIEDAKGKAAAIFADAQGRIATIEKSLQERVAIIRAQEREAKENLEKAEKVLFDAKQKKKQLVEA